MHGDLAAPATVDAVMDGITCVVLVSPAVPAQELNVIDSAARAGIRHIVKITSKSSADSAVARRRDQHHIEEWLIASGVGYTLLRNNAYMQNFLMLAPAIAHISEFGSNTGDGRIGMIDTRDIAAVAAEIATRPSRHAGKTYWPTGPQRLCYADAASIMSTTLGRPIAFHPLTLDQRTQQMLDAGLPVPIAETTAQALALFATGDSDWTTPSLRRSSQPSHAPLPNS